MTTSTGYGFRIRGGGGDLMQNAITAGDTAEIRRLLTDRFPGLQFEDSTTEEQVVAPEEATTTPIVAPLAQEAEEEVDGKTTTESLYNDYVVGLPATARNLITTDYKGVRGGRLGEGNYTTQSLIPGAQVATLPTLAPAPASAGGGGGTTTTVGGDYTQYYGDYFAEPVNFGTYYAGMPADEQAGAAETGTETAAPAAVGNWWVGAESASKAKAASKGLVPSATTVGAYVSPTDTAAKPSSQAAYQAVQESSGQGSAAKVSAAAGSDTNASKLNRSEVAALTSSGVSASKILKQSENQNIKLSNDVRKQLEKQASKEKK